MVGRHAVDLNGLPEDRGIAAEARLPVAIGDDGDRRGARPVVVRRERAPENGRHAEARRGSCRRPAAPTTASSGWPSTRTLTWENGANAKTSESAECWARKRSKISSENDVLELRPVAGSIDPLFSPARDILPRDALDQCGTARARPGFLTGSERSRKSLTRLKIAVLAPMPSASESTATEANPGFSRSSRAAWRRSRQSVSSARDRVHAEDLLADERRRCRTCGAPPSALRRETSRVRCSRRSRARDAPRSRGAARRPIACDGRIVYDIPIADS